MQIVNIRLIFQDYFISLACCFSNAFSTQVTFWLTQILFPLAVLTLQRKSKTTELGL